MALMPVELRDLATLMEKVNDLMSRLVLGGSSVTPGNIPVVDENGNVVGILDGTHELSRDPDWYVFVATPEDES